MNIYVFVGPTLPLEEARAELDAVYLPPVEQGDVYRAALDKPHAIAIVDGYFERVPTVWHKEILWAMAQGIHVIGSSSMGALRAAELAAFGMEGVGAIYEAFRSGALEDDDEVAVVHGPAEGGYRALSEAMVNIRATLRAATQARVIRETTRQALEEMAKALFYPERCYPILLERAGERGLPADEIAALRAFLPAGRIDQKKRDALALLRRLREVSGLTVGPKRVRYSFEHTDAWEQLLNQAGARRFAAQVKETAEEEELLEEVALAGPRHYGAARVGAMTRVLGLALARQQGLQVTEDLLQAAIDAFRQRHGLEDEAAARRWIAAQGLTEERFLELMREEAQLRWIETVYASDFRKATSDHLRVTGEYAAYAGRARDKRHRLAAAHLTEPTLGDLHLSEEQLWRWYFETRRGQSVPAEPAELLRHAQAAGFANRDAFRRALLREYGYLRGTLGQEEGLVERGERGGARARSWFEPSP
ncbi:MAG TPA: TfuA-like protein [Polyangia bacterium]|jgi:hypothetical protein|nr:TfuA-like protein [Polyangia bacterium]